jgi:hypothetical protein
MKKELKQGMIGGWQVWTLENLLENELYRDFIVHKQDRQKGEYQKMLEKECIIHRTEDQAIKSYASGEPISGFIVNNKKNEVYIIFRQNKKLRCKTINVETEHPVHSYFKDYYRVTIADDGENVARDVEDFKDSDSLFGVLLLPKLFEEGYERKNRNTLYCLIQSNWM